MLTGDAKETGEAVGAELSIDEVHAELLPQHKVDRIEAFDKQKLPKKSCFSQETASTIRRSWRERISGLPWEALALMRQSKRLIL